MVASCLPPRAMQAVAELHDTAFRLLTDEPGCGLGCCSTHRLPFQCAAIGAPNVPAGLFREVRAPTVSHWRVVTHDTPASALCWATRGLLVAWIAHARP